MTMKQLKHAAYLLCMLLGAFALASCSSDNDDEDTGGGNASIVGTWINTKCVITNSHTGETRTEYYYSDDPTFIFNADGTGYCEHVEIEWIINGNTLIITDKYGDSEVNQFSFDGEYLVLTYSDDGELCRDYYKRAGSSGGDIDEGEDNNGGDEDNNDSAQSKIVGTWLCYKTISEDAYTGKTETEYIDNPWAYEDCVYIFNANGTGYIGPDRDFKINWSISGNTLTIREEDGSVYSSRVRFEGDNLVLIDEDEDGTYTEYYRRG